MNRDLPMGALAKPDRTVTRDRRVKRQRVEKSRVDVKAFVRRDDGYKCRIPKCDCLALRLRPEVAHVVPLSLGGPDTPENMLLVCGPRHRGRPSIHSGDVKVKPVTKSGTRGLCDFYLYGKYLGSNEPPGKR